MPHTEEATPILEINFRRLLLACESKNRATIRLHIQQASSSTHDTHPTGTSYPHSTITLLHQIEALESMLSELDSRARERTMNLHKELDLGVDMDTASSQEQINVTNQMENVKQWSHRTTLIVEQWKQHVATMERTEARATSVSPATTRQRTTTTASPVLVQFRDTVPPLLNKTAGHHMERLPLRTPVAMQSLCPSSSKDLIATTNPTNTAATATTATTAFVLCWAVFRALNNFKQVFHRDIFQRHIVFAKITQFWPQPLSSLIGLNNPGFFPRGPFRKRWFLGHLQNPLASFHHAHHRHNFPQQICQRGLGFVVVRMAVKHMAASVSPSVFELRQAGAGGFVACHDVDDGGEQT